MQLCTKILDSCLVIIYDVAAALEFEIHSQTEPNELVMGRNVYRTLEHIHPYKSAVDL